MGPEPWDPCIPTIYPICTLKGPQNPPKRPKGPDKGLILLKSRMSALGVLLREVLSPCFGRV